VVVSSNVVLHGCAQPGSSVAVRSITVLPGATVRPLWFRVQGLGALGVRGSVQPAVRSITVLQGATVRPVWFRVEGLGDLGFRGFSAACKQHHSAPGPMVRTCSAPKQFGDSMHAAAAGRA
jgi:hypothetical protein